MILLQNITVCVCKLNKVLKFTTFLRLGMFFDFSKNVYTRWGPSDKEAVREYEFT